METSLKTTERTRLTDHHLSLFIKIGTAKSFHPDIEKLVGKKRCQVSGQNIQRESSNELRTDTTDKH